eukprot:403339224
MGIAVSCRRRQLVYNQQDNQSFEDDSQFKTRKSYFEQAQNNNMGKITLQNTCSIVLRKQHKEWIQQQENGVKSYKKFVAHAYIKFVKQLQELDIADKLVPERVINLNMLEFFKQLDLELLQRHPFLKYIIKDYYVNSSDEEELVRQIILTLCEFICQNDQHLIDSTYLQNVDLNDLLLHIYPLYNEFLLAFEEEIRKFNNKISNRNLSEVFNRFQLIFQCLEQQIYQQKESLSVRDSFNVKRMQKQIDDQMQSIIKILGRCFDLREIMYYECIVFQSQVNKPRQFYLRDYKRSQAANFESMNIVEYLIKNFAYKSAFYFINDLRFDIEISGKQNCHHSSILYQYFINLAKNSGEFSDLDRMYAKLLIRQSYNFTHLAKTLQDTLLSQNCQFIRHQAKKKVKSQIYKKYFLLMKIEEYSKNKLNRYIMSNIINYGKIEWFSDIDIYVTNLKQQIQLQREKALKYQDYLEGEGDIDDDDPQEEGVLINKLKDIKFHQQPKFGNYKKEGKKKAYK